MQQSHQNLDIENTKETDCLLENSERFKLIAVTIICSLLLAGSVFFLTKDFYDSVVIPKIIREQQKFTPVILTFENQPEKEIRDQIRSLGLRWNKFRKEWYGNVSDIESLNTLIQNQKHNLKILNDVK